MATESQEPIDLAGLFNWSINWLDANKEWVFSGIGVVVPSALAGFLGRLIKRGAARYYP